MSVEDIDASARLSELMEIRVPQTIAVLNHLGIADLLVDGPRPVDELAERSGAHALTLYRLLRYAAMHGVFTETAPRTFGLTPMASLLRADASGSRFWRVEGDVFVKPWLPWEEWLETAFTGEPAYDRMHGRSYWEALRAEPDARAVVDRSFRVISKAHIPVVVPLLDLADRRHLVDVGCSHATWLAALLERWPHLSGAAFDLPEAASAAQRTLERHGLTDRAAFVAGDFFEAVAEGDALLLGNVLHDWTDDDAARILRSCNEALSPGGRLFIVDRVLPEGDEPHHGKSVDINMLFLFGGRERTLRELDVVLAAAELVIERHIPTDLAVSVVVARRPGDR